MDASYFERKREEKRDEKLNNEKVKIGADKFVSQFHNPENELSKHTIGLVQLEDFQRIKGDLQQKVPSTDLRLKKKIKKRDATKLSFGDDEEPIEEGFKNDEFKKIKKNPNVDTSFLPDKVREEFEKHERERLKNIWIAEQDKIKKELVTVQFSFWDGTGHPASLQCPKGYTIKDFLEVAKKEWKELKSVHVDNLLFIKEDLIIPHHNSFYDFIINQTRGKSGPLFSFEIIEDVRLINDATKEVDNSHPAKIVLRSFYEKNKHIFPANRWEVFDPQKNYGLYTTK